MRYEKCGAKYAILQMQYENCTKYTVSKRWRENPVQKMRYNQCCTQTPVRQCDRRNAVRKVRYEKRGAKNAVQLCVKKVVRKMRPKNAVRKTGYAKCGKNDAVRQMLYQERVAKITIGKKRYGKCMTKNAIQQCAAKNVV